MELVFTNTNTLAQLQARVAEDGDLDGAKLMLAQTAVSSTRNRVLADFTQCNFSGYATSSPLVWNEPYLDAENDVPTVTCDTVEFRTTNATPFVPNEVYSVLLVSGATPPVLIASAEVDGAILMNAPLKSLQIMVRFPGEIIVVN